MESTATPSNSGGITMLSTTVPTTAPTTVPTAVPVAMPGVRPASADRSDAPGAFSIDCADCRHQHTSVCDDCIVTFIVGREPDDAIVVDADEARAVRLLELAGLVPGVRHSRRVG
jgi:hypothetical protein